MSSDPTWHDHRRTALHLLSMAVAAGTLFLFARAFLLVPCLGLYVLVAVTAWPIWEFQRELALFHRRIVLAGVTLEGSATRRAFWPGRLSVVWQVLVAVLWAALLLAFGALLASPQWLVLVADALVLALIIAPVRRMLQSQVRTEQLGFVSRRWPLSWLNVTGLTLAFLALDFFLVGAPDTRGMTWNVVAEKAFAEASATATCTLAGWLLGSLAALNQLSWHARQVLIPSLPGQEFKLVVWAVLLLQAGILALAYTRFQLGIVALIDRRMRPLAAPPEGASSKAFYLTIVALGLPFLFATYQLRDYDPASLGATARRVVAWANPCSPNLGAIAAVRTGLAAELESVRAAAKLDADQHIERELNALFANVEQGVDNYLDWYFSVVGEYQRLGAMVAGGFPALMTERLELHLFGGIQFDDRLRQASRSVASQSESKMAALTTSLGAQLKKDVRAQPCALDTLNLAALGDLERDRQRFTIAAASGMAAGALAVTLLARKAATGAVGKFASKNVFQAAATMGGKVAARRTGAIVLSAAGATAICGPGGPLAALCGIGAGVATWLAVDAALVSIDEFRFRDAMRAELLESALAQKAELASDLRALHHAAIDQMVTAISHSVERAFVPVRDGL